MALYQGTLGAILIGSLFAIFLSGVVFMQTLLYHRLFLKDPLRLKMIVTIVWVLDFAHATMICTANWLYFIDGYGSTESPKEILWPVSATIALTAVVTFLVHCFFSHRVWILSGHKLYITIPIVFLAILRVVSALGCTVRMTRLANWQAFYEDSAWLFTTGLSISAVLDFAIAMSLNWFLSKSRTGFKSMDYIIDSIMLYTIESGLLTSIAAIISLACWVAMPTNLVFLALHFAISKLYANSFLASLNARKTLQGRSQRSIDANSAHALPVLFPGAALRRRSEFNGADSEVNPNFQTTTLLQISVEKTVQCDGDVENMRTHPYSAPSSRAVADVKV